MSVIWMHQYRPRTAWYGLTDSERADYQARWEDVRQRSRNDTGGRLLGIFAVRGQSRFERLEVWEFPSASEVFDHWAALDEAEYRDWREWENLIGVDQPTGDAADTALGVRVPDAV